MSRKILIVDDDQDLRDIIKAALEKQGYEVQAACEGGQALKMAKVFEPELVIADLNMPGVSGWHFTMKLRMEERFKKLPIIVLSGLIDPDGSAEQSDENMVYVAKPFDVFQLMAKVKELLK